MTSPVGLLDFFILEAGDSIDRLDAAISGAATSAPDIDVMLRHARTLRGSSTMARQNGIAEVAAGIERVARALRDGESDWSPALHAALVAAVDDLKMLVRSVRNWSTADERRAQSRTAELARLAPEAPRRTPTPNTGADANMRALVSRNCERRLTDCSALPSACDCGPTRTPAASMDDIKRNVISILNKIAPGRYKDADLKVFALDEGEPPPEVVKESRGQGGEEPPPRGGYY